MSLHLYAENNDGDIVEVPGKLRADTLEVVQQAAEGAVGSSTIILDDPDAEFYIRGLKPLYLVEDDAITDDWFGLIGIFYSWNRTFLRGNHRTEAGREVHINVNDVNTLWTRRIQKGTDAKRPEETDNARLASAIDTAEFVGGTGDAGFSVEDRSLVFTDSPYPMSETDYTSQDSSGVINDLLQDSGKNAFLYPAPTGSEYVRVGMWYGRTERADYASPHRISNFLSDISPETLDPDWMFDPVIDYDTDEWTFAPSLDASLDRDPSRVASAVMVMADGSYAYVTNPTTRDAFAARDMVMQAELVKTQAQAERRASRYVRDLRNEDDAIECAVIVPNALVNAFVQGQRVQFRCSFLPGYSADFVWLRIAQRTVRQLSSGSGLYELALDLRAEEPPDSATTGNGLEPCSDQTASDTWYALGGSGDTSNPSPTGNVFYWQAGGSHPITVADAVGHQGHTGFAIYGAGGVGTSDALGDCIQNRVTGIVDGNGTMTISTSEYLGVERRLQGILYHRQYNEGEEGDPTSGVNVVDEVKYWFAGDDESFDITTHGGVNCTHWVDITDNGSGCGSKWVFNYIDWDAT